MVSLGAGKSKQTAEVTEGDTHPGCGSAKKHTGLAYLRGSDVSHTVDDLRSQLTHFSMFHFSSGLYILYEIRDDLLLFRLLIGDV